MVSSNTADFNRQPSGRSELMPAITEEQNDGATADDVMFEEWSHSRSSSEEYCQEECSESKEICVEDDLSCEDQECEQS